MAELIKDFARVNKDFDGLLSLSGINYQPKGTSYITLHYFLFIWSKVVQKTPKNCRNFELGKKICRVSLKIDFS